MVTENERFQDADFTDPLVRQVHALLEQLVSLFQAAQKTSATYAVITIA